ncbi:hypothetical protein B0H17DRAFT_1141812 [Mycena rosella]|uniref:Uncharacterized protein n=1 Tax=Mycena rosella TaxID=1033263 RepID=A0AAD7CZ96_MYCRO|nr:hypothetical protein B0H17DRAFT_1141812 [Mycena rosella]
MVSSTSATLSGVVFLRNPRRLGRSKTWFFDGAMYLDVDERGEEQGIILLMRYLNKEDHYFGEIGVANVKGNICEMSSKFDLGGKDFHVDDYSFAVDIQEMIPIHETMFETSDNGDKDTDNSDETTETRKEPVVRLPQINTLFPPYLTICGLPYNRNPAKATFDIDAEMYTQFRPGHSPFPVSCWIIDSRRWTSVAKKPMPFEGKYAQVTGYLSGVGKCFQINVGNVTFMGNAPSSSNTGTPSSTPGKCYHYLDARLSLTSVAGSSQTRAPAASQVQNHSGTPSWAANKRKRNDGDAARSSSPV